MPHGTYRCSAILESWLRWSRVDLAMEANHIYLSFPLELHLFLAQPALTETPQRAPKSMDQHRCINNILTGNVWKQFQTEATETVFRTCFQPGRPKLVRQRQFKWMSICFKKNDFRKEDLKMKFGGSSAFCGINICFWCLYEILRKILYIWTYTNIYFDIIWHLSNIFWKWW